ncbi:MAG: pyruvyl transferase EpsI [Thermosediminibacterales bacterium]|nr:pyruvyl transferase EpsI [Thermosediminibacterales bacterium]
MWNHIRIVKIIKNILPLWLKLIIIRLWVTAQYFFYYYIAPKKIVGLDNNKRKIFVLLSTDYSNLGDHAMTYAQIKLLEKNFPQCQIVEILVSDTLKYIKHLLKIITHDDVITLKGGGNIGLEYFREELFRRIIIKKFSNNKIIMFPQTIYFPDTKKGRKEFNKTIQIFRAHSKFYAFIRDSISFELVKEQIGNRVFLIPDIALSLGNLEIEKERSGLTICLRDDKEGIYTKEQKNMIINIGKKYFDKVNTTDTVTDYVIKKEQRESELYKIWTTFSSSELVITDRLHGMIFAAITSTPCIVLGTYNHKLIGQYKWLEHLNYIKFTKCEKNDIDSAIQELKDIKVKPYDGRKYSELYKKIIELI